MLSVAYQSLAPQQKVLWIEVHTAKPAAYLVLPCFVFPKQLLALCKCSRQYPVNNNKFLKNTKQKQQAFIRVGTSPQASCTVWHFTQNIENNFTCAVYKIYLYKYFNGVYCMPWTGLHKSFWHFGNNALRETISFVGVKWRMILNEVKLKQEKYILGHMFYTTLGKHWWTCCALWEGAGLFPR